MEKNSSSITERMIQHQLDAACKKIELALSEYSGSTTSGSFGGGLWFLHGEYIWAFLGFTPCKRVKELICQKYDIDFVFGKPIAQSAPEVYSKECGFTYGTPLVGIPLPR